MTRQTLSPAAALREAARQLEHGCEFNVDRMRGWTAAEKAMNYQLIARSRELHARADRLECGCMADEFGHPVRKFCSQHGEG